MAGSYVSQTGVAAEIPYDNTGTGLTGSTVQEVITEIATSSIITRTTTLWYYGGNANTGRYLELFPALPSNEAPLSNIGASYAEKIIVRTTSVTATCTIGFYNIQPVTPVLLYTATMTAQKKLGLTGTLFTLPAGGELAILVDTGSINKPHIQLVTRGG